MDAMETAADEGMAACEAIRAALASDEDRVAFDDAVFVAREILDLHDGTLHDGTPKAPSAPPAPSETETDGASHPLIAEATALREGGVDELLEIAGDVAAALERRAADAVAAVRGAEGADAVVSAATRLRLLDEADELVAEMRGECARRVAAFALVVVSHLRTAQSGEGSRRGENLGSSVAARAGETRAAVDGALRELEGYAKDAAEAMRAATADVDAALGAPTEPSDGSGSAPPVASVGAAAAEACAGTWVPIARDVVADAAQCVVFPLVAASRSGGTEAAAAGGGERRLLVLRIFAKEMILSREWHFSRFRCPFAISHFTDEIRRYLTAYHTDLRSSQHFVSEPDPPSFEGFPRRASSARRT